MSASPGQTDVHINARGGGRVQYEFTVEGSVAPSGRGNATIDPENDTIETVGDGTVVVSGLANQGQDRWVVNGSIIDTRIISSSGSWYAEIGGRRLTESTFDSYADNQSSGGPSGGGLLSSLTETQKYLIAGGLILYMASGEDLIDELTQGNRPLMIAAVGGYWYFQMGGRETLGSIGMGSSGSSGSSNTPTTGNGAVRGL